MAGGSPRTAVPITVHTHSPSPSNIDSAPESSSTAFWSSVCTLTLGILGSSVLPVPWAFSRTGVLPGLLFSAIVAVANSVTGTILIRAAAFLNKKTYEGTFAAAFGSFRSAAQLCLTLLLFGTLAGDAALLADTGTLALKDLCGDRTLPEWMIANGRTPMLFLIVVLVVPLSLSRKMRNLEKAALAGVGLVIILAVVIVKNAVAAGFPAISTGQLPIAKIPSATRDQLPEALSVLFFAFYTQPMLLPLLSEMPPGKRGQDILCSALQIVTVVIALLVYSVVGIFGAARYGLETEGDVLVNRWFSDDRASGVLDLSMAVYLSISMAPMAITMRYLLDSVIAKGELSEFSFWRDAGLTVGGIAAATSVAWAWPQQAEALFAVTGATAVCLISYIIPVAIHLKLYFTRRRRAAVFTEQEAWLLEDAALLESRGGRGESGSGSSGEYQALLDRRESSVLEGVMAVQPPPRRENTSGNSSSSSEPILVPILPKIYVEHSSAGGRYPHVSELRELSFLRTFYAILVEIVLPIAVLVLGVGVSASALALSIKKLV